jgi:hypothetical protein
VDEAGRYQLLGDNLDTARNSSILVPSSLVLGRVTSRFSTF